MSALPTYLIEPIWQQFSELLPTREVDHPLGCHRSRVPDRVVFEKLVQVLVFGCAYWRIADELCSATTLRRRRDEWIGSGVMDALRKLVLEAYDRLIGLELDDVVIDGCITKAPCGGERAGRSPVDRGKQGLKRSTVVDANGIPLGAVVAPANRHDSPLLADTLETLKVLGPMPERISVHLDRGYDSDVTRQRLNDRGLSDVICEKGKPAPLAATNVGWWNARTPGITLTRNYSGVPNAGDGSSTSGSLSPRWSSSCADSFDRPGPTTAGRQDLTVGRDLPPIGAGSKEG